MTQPRSAIRSKPRRKLSVVHGGRQRASRGPCTNPRQHAVKCDIYPEWLTGEVVTSTRKHDSISNNSLSLSWEETLIFLLCCIETC